MGRYKLVALDMDGTLLNESSEISERNAQAIADALAEGVQVCFSTGRGFRSALPFAEQLNLETPMITVNGGEIWHRPHVLHRRRLLSHEYVRQMHELALSEHADWFWAYTTEQIYNKENWITPADAYEDYHWLKFGYYTENEEQRQRILQEVSSWGALEITNSSPFNLEMNPAGVSKASAIEELCALQQISMQEVVAVGDSLNDIAAIRACGLGVAMGNAQQAVKEAADMVTDSNNEDGVAKVIYDYVLKV